jgi:hypothetical protein
MRKTSHRQGKRAVRAGLCVAASLAMLAVMIPAQSAGAASPQIQWNLVGPSVVGNVATWTVTAVENDPDFGETGTHAEPLSVGCNAVSGSAFPVGTTTVTCTATDLEDGDVGGSTHFDVVVAAPDTDLAFTLPIVNPAPVPAFAPIGATVNFTIPAATDEDGPVSVSCDHQPGDTFAIGTTNVTCTATDPDDTPSSVQATVVVKVTPTKPGAPTIGTATAGNGSASVAFTPGRLGSSDTTDFVASCSSANSGNDGSAHGVGSPIVVTGLTNGITYTCSVYAINATGNSPSSGPSNAVVPGGKTVEVDCTDQTVCDASLGTGKTDSTAGQATSVTGTPDSPVGSVVLATGPGKLSCPSSAGVITPLSTLTTTGFSSSSVLVVTLTENAVSNSPAKICLSKTLPFLSEQNPTTPAPGTGILLPCASVGGEAPCQISSTVSNGKVTVVFKLRGGDPVFRLVLPPGGRLLWPSAFPVGKVGSAYAARLQSSGGKAPYHWKIASGKLAAGLALNGSTGAITGKPKAKGTFSCLVQATDSESPPKSAKIVVSITIK